MSFQQAIAADAEYKWVDRGRGLVVEGLVRADVVEVGQELVEASLLSCPVTGWLSLEGTVHASVSRFDEFGQDTELDPPDGELG